MSRRTRYIPGIRLKDGLSESVSYKVIINSKGISLEENNKNRTKEKPHKETHQNIGQETHQNIGQEIQKDTPQETQRANLVYIHDGKRIVRECKLVDVPFLSESLEYTEEIKGTKDNNEEITLKKLEDSEGPKDSEELGDKQSEKKVS